MEPALVGVLLDGKFQIDKVLGSGASGDVYEAVHVALGARVAVKVLKPGAVESAEVRRRRFLREARVAARVQSDHVVRVFDVIAPEEGPTYIVMELLTGETLAERMQRTGRLGVAEAVGHVLQAAEPLAELHDAGIVHRDVKPSNLFVCRDRDGTERVKLIDFGVAAFRAPPAGLGDVPASAAPSPHLAGVEASLTLTEAMIGTPRFMSPEQVRGAGEVDARTDVWALGVTLYFLLSGRPPFDGETVPALLSQIERDEPPPLGGARSDVPAGLARVVHRCLSKDPAARPADARALREALAPFGPSRGGARAVTRGRATLGAVVVGLAVLGVWTAGRPTAAAPLATVAADVPAPRSESSAPATEAPLAASAAAEAPPVISARPTLAAPRATASATKRAALPPVRPSRALQDDDRIE